MKQRQKKYVAPQTEHTQLEALTEAYRTNPEKRGMSAKELADASGLHIVQIRRQLAVMIQQGRAYPLLELRPSIAGYDRKVPVYSLKK